MALLLALFCMALPQSARAADSPKQVLTTVAAVRSLSPAEAARHYPVKLHAAVTFCDEALFSRFVQDSTAGIYLQEMTNMPPLRPGQAVDVEGVTGPGEYAPVIIPTSVKVAGGDQMPAAAPVSPEQLISGREDSQFVEFSGVVRSVHFDKDTQYFLIDFVKGGERFTVYAKQLPLAPAENLVASTVKVRGVCSTMFNHQRQLFGIRLLVPLPDGVVIEKPAPANPFDLPVQNLNSLLQFAPEGNLGDRVKVQGTVVYDEPGISLFIENTNGGLYCQTLQREALQPGDQVEVLGFPAKGDYTPILQDAIFRKVGTGAEPKAGLVDINRILTGSYDCRLVQLPARVLDRVQRGVNQFLLLQSGDFTFQAYLPTRVNTGAFDALQNGSKVMVTGICLIERGNNWQAGEQWRASSFHLLLRSPNDVTAEELPSSWNLPDQPAIMTGLAVIAMGALAWVGFLSLKLRRQAAKK